jgi:hypothetical protein
MQLSTDALHAFKQLLEQYTPGAAGSLQLISQALAPALQEHGAHVRDVTIQPLLLGLWNALQSQLAALRAAAGLPAVPPLPPPW